MKLMDEFLPVIREKLGIQQGVLFNEDNFSISRQRNTIKDFADHLASLPYVFRDAIRFDKRNDPKKKTYGSKIDLDSIGPNDSIHVRKVFSPSKLLLDNGLDIQLLGIKGDSWKK